MEASSHPKPRLGLEAYKTVYLRILCVLCCIECILSPPVTKVLGFRLIYGIALDLFVVFMNPRV
jgi:hypothetical protein